MQVFFFVTGFFVSLRSFSGTRCQNVPRNQYSETERFQIYRLAHNTFLNPSINIKITFFNLYKNSFLPSPTYTRAGVFAHFLAAKDPSKHQRPNKNERAERENRTSRKAHIRRKNGTNPRAKIIPRIKAARVYTHTYTPQSIIVRTIIPPTRDAYTRPRVLHPFSPA